MAEIAWILETRDTSHRSAHLFWRALPAYQQSPMIKDLLISAVESEVDRHVEAVASYRHLAADSFEHRLLLELGFGESERLEVFEAPFDAVWSRCRRIHALLERRHSIPDAAQIVAFEPRRLPELRAVFHNSQIVSCLDFDARLSPQHEEAIDLERSTAIVLDETLIGAMLVCPIKGGAGYLVSGRWVAPEFRNGWVNAVLIYNSVRQGVDLSLDFVRFVANSEAHQETVRLASRLGGKRVRSLERLSRPIRRQSDHG